VATPTAPTGGLVLTRAAFRTELADFGKLANGIKASFVADGAKVDAVTPGSLFARAGLKGNDVVLAVNGQPLRSIDDAAELYAHASAVKVVAIDVRRAGKSVTLHVTIQ
jgi:serine protease DegS